MVSRGRPTKYHDSLPDELEDAMSNGRSITQFARDLGVSRSTIYEWAESYQEFSDALTRGKEYGEAYWETELQSMMYSKEVNAPLVKLYFANRFGWSDKSEVDSKSSDGSMTPKESFDASQLSTAALKELMAARAKPDDK